MRLDGLRKAYIDVILESNIDSMLKEYENLKLLYDDNIISEGWFDWIGDFAKKVKGLFNTTKTVFKAGFNAVKIFCEKVFSWTWFNDLLKKYGMSYDLQKKLASLAKKCIIIIPAAQIGVGIYKGIKNDIKDNDFKALIDIKKFNKESAKLFSEQTLMQKIWFIVKSFGKNLAYQAIYALPLILKCTFAYAVVQGFEGALEDAKNDHLDKSTKNSLDKIDKTHLEVVNNAKTEEEALAIIEKNYSPENSKDCNPAIEYAGKLFLLRNTAYENPETGKMEHLQYFHGKEADVGKALNAHEGSAWTSRDDYTYFDKDSGEYVTKKLSDDPLSSAERQSQMPGMQVQGAPGNLGLRIFNWLTWTSVWILNHYFFHSVVRTKMELVEFPIELHSFFEVLL